MSVIVTLNGIPYEIPTTGEVGWGQNTTNYLVALGSGGLLSLEEVPAYERKRVVLDSTPASNESQASRFGISEVTDANGEKRYELKGNNPFLHDNVD